MAVPMRQWPEPVPIEFENLHIFAKRGHTLSFKNGEIVVDNETMLAFNYGAQSDGKSKHAVFQKSKIVGYSISKRHGGLS